MQEFKINSPVVLFNHKEYETRLLFEHGTTNPRDMLGKNGVTIHGWFAAWFYNTIRIQAELIGEDGKKTTQTFNVNRNSLIKYLGKEDKKTYTDQELITALDAVVWKDDTNTGQQARDIQMHGGAGGLRHAGRHNQHPVATGFLDRIKASFLGWLYEKTIAGMNRIKVRFLFVRTEANLFDAGEQLAIQRFHDAYREVPAYKTHIVRFNGVPVKDTTFGNIPATDKSNYIKYQEHDSDTHRYGKYPAISKTDTSTGTTGKPTEWVRGEPELQVVKQSLKLATKLLFGKRKLSYINAFALGPWATGLTAQELMRETGSVFATGSDKVKIIDKIVNIAKYEAHQLKLAIDGFVKQYPVLTDDDKSCVIAIISKTLQVMLKNSDAVLEDKLFLMSKEGDKRTQAIMRQHQAELLAIATKLNSEKQQIIIAGYPPFLKELTAEARKRDLKFEDYAIVGIVGGQAISEAMRDRLIKEGFQRIYSSYGASDLDINLGVETDYETMVRKAIENKPGLARELYGANKGLPMVFHYDPMNYHVECDDTDELIFTCTRNGDRSSPRVRYDLGDKGRVYAASDVEALLTKYGIFKRPKTNLPFMFVWGRDSTVIFNGANLAFTELERAVTNDEELESRVLKKAFYKVDDDHFEMWFELKDNEELPTSEQMNTYANHLFSELARLNQDFSYQLGALSNGAALPTLRFFRRGESPISEAGGHRKQVLVFEKGVNLDNEYRFPGENSCTEITYPKSASLLEASAPALRSA